MDRFDLILLYCFALTVAVCAGNLWLIANGLPQFEAPMWGFLTAAVTGEIVMFSLYQIAKRRGAKAPRFTRARHQAIDEMEEDDGN